MEIENIKEMTPSGIIRAALTKFIFVARSISLLFLLWGCSAPTEVSPVEPTSTLKPYIPSSSTPTDTRVIPTITVEPTPGPTATPFVHVVQKEDTLLGIAIRYGVSLEEILAANPGINPTILSIGQKIVIPGPEGDSASNFLPVATPLPLHFSEVQCFPTTSQHLWCLSTLKNQEGYPLEGVSVYISLLNENGDVVASELTFSPVHLIPEGSSIPLSALFSLSPDGYSYAILLPVTAYPAENIEERYIPLKWVLEMSEPGEDRRTWDITGQLLSLSDTEKIPERVSILAVALDYAGSIVGFRKLEMESELKPGDEVPFDMKIFSLGPPIDHVEILAEALAPLSVE
jgi:LysM repeat protein